MRRSGLLVFVALALGVSDPARRAAAADAPPLDEIVVTGSRTGRPLAQSSPALSVVDRHDVEDGRAAISLDESLARVPGLYVQNSGNFAQDLRLQIRGFGTRAAFGIREIKVFVDGLPETLPDGQTQVDAIDLGAIERIEVLRRPAGALYGNASGGVIQLFTAEGSDEPEVNVRALGGSFGRARYQASGGGRHGPWKLFAHVARTETDGHRDHAAARSTSGLLKLRYDIDDRTDLTFLVHAVDAPIAEDPGALTRAEADADPGAARELNVLLDAGEAVREARAGMVLHHDGSIGRVSAYAYGACRDFENRLAVRPEQGAGIVAFDRFSPGAGAQVERPFTLFGSDQKLLLGFDLQHQDDDRIRFTNVDGQRGELLLAQRERVSAAGAYLQHTVDVRDDVELFAGARFDAIRFDVDVDFDATDSPSAGNRTLDAWSPVGGLRVQATPLLAFFASVSTAFQTPTTTELADPDGGGFDPDLEPQTSLGYDLGARFTAERVQLGLAGFFLRVEDQILRFESESGRDDYRNAGRSRRFGIEADAQWSIGRGFVWSSALTWLETEFRDYTTVAGDFAGNEEPGTPSWQVFQELRWDHASGVFAAADAFVVDDLYVDDANQVRSEGYALVGARAGWEIARGAWTFAPFVGLTNLLDERYDGTVRLNALGGRYFEPGPGRAFVIGIGVGAAL
jgi:iron complex outermembrane receptor protein